LTIFKQRHNNIKSSAFLKTKGIYLTRNVYFPNPDIEMRLKVQVTDVHRKSRKTKVTSLVMKLFLGFLGASRTCAIIVLSISGFGYLKKLSNYGLKSP